MPSTPMKQISLIVIIGAAASLLVIGLIALDVSQPCKADTFILNGPSYLSCQIVRSAEPLSILVFWV
jgi:hypothetical protein